MWGDEADIGLTSSSGYALVDVEGRDRAEAAFTGRAIVSRRAAASRGAITSVTSGLCDESRRVR